jgi:hypothetical protein
MYRYCSLSWKDMLEGFPMRIPVLGEWGMGNWELGIGIRASTPKPGKLQAITQELASNWIDPTNSKTSESCLNVLPIEAAVVIFSIS